LSCPLVLCGESYLFDVFSLFFFSSRRRHTRFKCDWSQTCALPISYVVGHAIGLPCSLIITKEKQFVFDDRSAHRTAKLIPLRMRQRHVRCLIEWVARLRGIRIPQPKGTAVQRFRSRLYEPPHQASNRPAEYS